MKNYILKNKTKTAFFGISIILLFLMLFMSRNAGISGDEYFHVDHSVNVLNYYKTFGKDTSALYVDKGLLHFYGQSLDTENHILNEMFNIEDIYLSRHLTNTFIGWILILFTGLTTVLIFGWEAGIVALILMFFSPKLLGHTWNNLKDIPFAASYMFSLYFILKYIKTLPKLNWQILVLVILGIGWAISLRIGGLILVPYLFLFVAMYFLTEKNFYTKSGFLHAVKIAGYLIVAAMVAYLLGLLLWPYGLKDPIHNPINALKEMTNYDIGLNQLYEGTITMSKNLPWSYGLKYILITSPIVVFVGLIAFFSSLPFKKSKRIDYLLYSFLVFAFAFPIAYTIYKNSNLYGGWRHLLWTYSPIVVLSAGGFNFFLAKKNKYIKLGAAAIITILLIKPVIHTFKNHPYQYIYYNQLVGGVKGAYGKYETDYYYHSLREGAEWLIDNEVGEDTIIVATNHSRITEYYFRDYPQVKVVYSRYYDKSKTNWDYAIWANTLIEPSQIENKFWPPKVSIHTMDVDGQPIGAVVKRISYDDYNGFQAVKNGKIGEAKQYFKNVLKQYPENEEVLEAYSRIFLAERNYDSTLYYADLSINYNPRQIGALLVKASVLNTKKDYQGALEIANQMIEIKSDFNEAHYQKGYALKNLNQPNDALKEFQIAIGYKKDYTQAYLEVGNILCNYKNYTKAIEFYDKLLELQPSNLQGKVYKAKCLQLSGKNDQAEELLNQIPASNQNNVEVVKVKCRIAMAKNNWNLAANYLNMARFITTDADLFVLRSKYVLRQNDLTLAEKYIKSALEFDPTNREAQEVQKSLQANAKPAQQNQNQSNQQQSVMFQKPEEKKTNSITIPTR